MSLCYNFQKWTIITLATVAISLTFGLVLIAHGYVDGNNNGKDDVEEWWNASHLYANDQVRRYDDCIRHEGQWNGSSCHLKVPHGQSVDNQTTIDTTHGQTVDNQSSRDINILNNGIVSPTDPEISCNKINSNCHYIFKNETVKLTEELFKACTIEKDTLWYGDFLQLNNTVNCSPIIDYYIDHNWQPWFSPVVIDNKKITLIRVIAKYLGK